MILAGIDIGTNTLRLLVVEYRRPKWKELFSDRQVTRLGEGFLKNKTLIPPAIERTLSALKSFQRSLQRFSCDQILVVATSAVREAENQKSFVDLIKEEVGLEVQIISGEEEARLTYLGIRSAVPFSDDYQMMVDIGGGSTEWILGRRQILLSKRSSPLGAVFLTEKYLLSDPPSSSELIQMKKKVRESLVEIKETFKEALEKNPPITWIGTAGTVTTLAAMAQGLEEYSFEKVNRFVLTQEAVSGLYQTLISKTKDARKKIKGLEPGREDIIVAGAFIVLEMMLYFNFNRMVVSDYGLREGILLDRIQQLERKT
ncbi:MAG: Ppx/GppA phosphatase family protein [Nitrospiria bacterium]